jgi:hypothetical protein
MKVPHPDPYPNRPSPSALPPGWLIPAFALAPLLLAGCADDVTANCPPLAHRPADPAVMRCLQVSSTDSARKSGQMSADSSVGAPAEEPERCESYLGDAQAVTNFSFGRPTTPVTFVVVTIGDFWL